MSYNFIMLNIENNGPFLPILLAHWNFHKATKPYYTLNYLFTQDNYEK
jgi:hypothetical protein